MYNQHIRVDFPLLASLTLFSLLMLALPLTAQASTLEEVQGRGVLNCGVSEGLKGFSDQNAEKKWTGFDVDYCRAVSAAIFGDPDKVNYVPLSTSNRFEALNDKKIDILARNTTWTLSRDVELQLSFIGTSYYDGQGFMTRETYGLSSALQLAEATICVLEATTSETNATQFFKARNINVNFVKFTDREELIKAYDGGKCEAFSADRSGLASVRSLLSSPVEHILLPEVISKEPLGPVVRSNDTQWINLSRWVLFLLINAEEAGWSQEKAAKGELPQSIQISDEVSKKLGLKSGWAVNVIKSTGHYGEIFARNIGEQSPLALTRGVNALWSRGGILYAPPMR